MTPREKAHALIRKAIAEAGNLCCCEDACGCPGEQADAVLALFPEVEERLSYDNGRGWAWPVQMAADRAKANRTQLVLFTDREEIDGGA